jgi:hypothetical protein
MQTNRSLVNLILTPLFTEPQPPQNTPGSFFLICKSNATESGRTATVLCSAQHGAKRRKAFERGPRLGLFSLTKLACLAVDPSATPCSKIRACSSTRSSFRASLFHAVAPLACHGPWSVRTHNRNARGWHLLSARGREPTSNAAGSSPHPARLGIVACAPDGARAARASSHHQHSPCCLSAPNGNRRRLASRGSSY